MNVFRQVKDNSVKNNFNEIINLKYISLLQLTYKYVDQKYFNSNTH